MAKVTGIGGVFFKSRNDHKALAKWYQENLGVKLEDWGGAILKWPDDKGPDKGLTVWHGRPSPRVYQGCDDRFIGL